MTQYLNFILRFHLSVKKLMRLHIRRPYQIYEKEDMHKIKVVPRLIVN
jgi:hypothetical protein